MLSFFLEQVLVADSDDEVVDHASLLNSFGNENTNIITPVPRMHSIKPEWDEDVSCPPANAQKQQATISAKLPLVPILMLIIILPVGVI